MSDTIHLACLTCRVELWVGQGGYTAPHRMRLYGDDEHQAAFAAFYDAHPPRDGHDIRLVHLEGLYALADEWREFGDDEVHGRPTDGTDYLGLNDKVRIRHDTSIIPASWAKMKVGDPVTFVDFPKPGNVTKGHVTGEIRLRGDYHDLTGDEE
jgi:hypothetical protein